MRASVSHAVILNSCRNSKLQEEGTGTSNDEACETHHNEVSGDLFINSKDLSKEAQ